VLMSLAPRHGETLKLLANLQTEKQPLSLDQILEAKKPVDVSEYGVEYQSFRTQCQAKMFVNADGVLRVMMKELADHDIAVMRASSQDGKEYVYIPHGKATLRLIMNFEVV
jgi:hypothetical protein